MERSTHLGDRMPLFGQQSKALTWASQRNVQRSCQDPLDRRFLDETADLQVRHRRERQRWNDEARSSDCVGNSNPLTKQKESLEVSGCVDVEEGCSARNFECFPWLRLADAAVKRKQRILLANDSETISISHFQIQATWATSLISW